MTPSRPADAAHRDADPGRRRRCLRVRLGASSGTGRRTSGRAISDPTDFSKSVLDSLAYAGLLFVVAAASALIFGLMRTVNMAHGSYYLLGGLIGVRLELDFGHALPGGFALTAPK